MNKSIAFTTILAVIVATVFFCSDLNRSTPEVPKEVILAFNEWKMSSKRLYASPEEQNHRLRVFYENYKKVESVNSQNLSYKFKLNDFADLSHEEFSAKYLMKPTKLQAPKGAKILTKEDLKGNELQQAADFNWCQKGKCSAVRLQGSCAAGYAFSGAKVLEYAFNVAGKGRNIWLAPQEYIDCSGNFGNMGCGGGYVTNALQYSTYYGLAYETNYSYTDRQGVCRGTS